MKPHNRVALNRIAAYLGGAGGVESTPIMRYMAEEIVTILGDETEPKKRFMVELVHVGENKINVIKTIRNLTGMDLKEAKDLVEAMLPVPVMHDVSEEDAQRVCEIFKPTGAMVAIRAHSLPR